MRQKDQSKFKNFLIHKLVYWLQAEVIRGKLVLSFIYFRPKSKHIC